MILPSSRPTTMSSSILASSSTQPTSSSAKSTPTRHTRKKTAENWDDDFDFIPRSAKGSSAGPSTSTGPDENAPSQATRIPGRSSPTDSIISSWDDSPPRSAPMIPTRSASKASSAGLHLALPRHSPSHISALPSPSSSSSSNRHSLASPIPASHDQQPLSRIGSNNPNATTRQKLVKRHPSTSFITTSHPSSSATSVASYANRSSPHLPRMASREAMPPPPLPPAGLERRKSKGKSRLAGRSDEVRVSNIPFSPSQEAMREAERRPSFWKRLSGATTPTSKRESGSPGVWVNTDIQVTEEQRHRRRRSSSLGQESSPSKPRAHRPPVPSLPLGIRSSSAASGTSDVSVISQVSASSNSSYRSGPASALSSILRRSSSTLSKQSDRSAKTPPSAYTPILRASPIPSSPGIPMPARRDATPTPPPSSHSFSRGFHLPSPLPGSPYSETEIRFPPMPTLPHSRSFPAPPPRGSDTETEPEIEANDITPKRKKKVRPVSEVPGPRATSRGSSRGWNGHDWKGFSDAPNPPPRQDSLAVRSESRSSYHKASASEIVTPSSPQSGSFASTTSTFRRLGSISKKHGRRLSGGFKFGTGSSSSTGTSEIRRGSQTLETVAGSPSKPHRSPVRKQIPQPLPDDMFRSATRAGSVSAPNSHFKANTMGKTEVHSGLNSSLSEDALAAKKEKKARRTSLGDFTIPKDVLAKQKGLKEDKGAIKKFDSGVKVLKRFMEQHAELCSKLQGTGSEADRAIFDRLEADFDQWWEMATVLVEVGETGATATTQPDSATHAPSNRTRRTTLSSEKARATAETLAKLEHNTARDYGTRSASLPEPEVDPGLPRTDMIGQRFNSTGRHDLSKRQIEVLRGMFREPHPTRPEMRRGSSTLSVSTSGGMMATSRSTGARTPVDRIISGVTFPSPPDSTHVNPSASFPSPLTASTLAQPRPGLKSRKSSKAGLAGLKEFLRFSRKSSTTVNRAARHVPAQRIASRQEAPVPSSPITRTTGGFEEVQYPTTRSSFSAQRDKPASPPRRVPSPRKEAKRPSIRNIFNRTSSGNWSELVRGTSSPVPPLPERKSIDSNPDREEISGMPRQGILRQPSTNGIRPSKTPTSTSFQLPSKAWRSPKKFRQAKDIDVAGYEYGQLSRALSRESSQNSTKLEEGKVEVDQTVRPKRKSRIMGLGIPPSPSSPSAPQWRQAQVQAQATAALSASAISQAESVPMAESRNVSGSTTWSAGTGNETSSTGTGMGMDDSEDDTVVLLSPENLPVLLEYLEQCQAKLVEWRMAVVEIENNQVRGVDTAPVS